MTLRYSRRCFRRVVWNSSKETWAQLHEQAFRYFGGTTAYVVLDNLKEGVIKPDLYEPELNSVYRDVLAHYGVVADPARVRDPNRKGTVENAIQHTQSTALKGRRFETIDEQNVFLEQWETKWAAPRIHGSAKRQVEAMFRRSAPTSAPCPYRASATTPSASAPSPTTPACASTTAATRRAPPRSAAGCWCACSSATSRSATVSRWPCCARTRAPSAPAACCCPTTSGPLIRRARRVVSWPRPATSATPRYACASSGLSMRAESGSASCAAWWLARRYPRRLIDQACAQALQENARTYQSIKNLTERLLAQAMAEIDAPRQAELDLEQHHPLIREGDDYADLFTRAATASAAIDTTKERP
jgi:hypothetical protein